MVSSDSRLGLIQPLGTTVQDGIPVNTPLVVPADRFAVLAKNSEAVYALPGGSHNLQPSNCPLLKVRRSRRPDQPETLVAGCYLVRADHIRIPWEYRLPIASTRRQAMQYYTLKGDLVVRVIDPLNFFRSTYQAALEEGRAKAQDQSFRLSQPEKQAQRIAWDSFLTQGDSFCSLVAANAIEQFVQRFVNTPEQLFPARKEIQTAVGENIARELMARGVELCSFRLDAPSSPYPMPCMICGSTSSPTASASFSFNVSLLVVRYTGSRSGTFCLPCALKTGLGYTTLTLFCGWWGLIGLVFTPIILVLNMFHLIRVLVTRKPNDAALSAMESQR